MPVLFDILGAVIKSWAKCLHTPRTITKFAKKLCAAAILLEDALVLAYSQLSAVNETDSCAFVHQNSLDQSNKLNNCLFLQFHVTVVG